MFDPERTWLEVTQKHIEYLAKQRAKVDAERNDLDEKVKSLDAEIELYEKALACFPRRPQEPSLESEGTRLIPGVVADLSLRRVYEYLAGLDGGIAVCTRIARQMSDNGLASDYGSALATVHSTLHRAAKRGYQGWSKVGRGRYRFSGPPIRVQVNGDSQGGTRYEQAFAGSKAVGPKVKITEF